MLHENKISLTNKHIILPPPCILLAFSILISSKDLTLMWLTSTSSSPSELDDLSSTAVTILRVGENTFSFGFELMSSSWLETGFPSLCLISTVRETVSDLSLLTLASSCSLGDSLKTFLFFTWISDLINFFFSARFAWA